MPETSEGTVYDELGVCRACQSSEQKMHIDWAARERLLHETLEHYRAKAGDNYDCIVPISGGKDSAFQLHVLVKKYGMKPLAVTFSHNWYSPTGKRNLWNILDKLSVDHLMFTPARGLVNKVARQSLHAIGDSCWHCHAGVNAFPLQVAVMYGIPLMVWGESSAEAGNKNSYSDEVKFDRSYFDRVSTKARIDDLLCDNIERRDMYPFRVPLQEQLDAMGFHGIFLGEYIFWDGERQTEFLKEEYGWEEDNVEGTYKRYKSVECRMPGVHDYAKYLKRGFGRATDHASQDVRAGLLTREEAFELIKEYDPKRPDMLDYYLEITGFSEDEFEEILKSQRKGPAASFK
tara:strand:- start:120 stop:1157 length:1038 start_codon:yes stop_codon:yes gene_type:complete